MISLLRNEGAHLRFGAGAPHGGPRSPGEGGPVPGGLGETSLPLLDWPFPKGRDASPRHPSFLPLPAKERAPNRRCARNEE